MGPAFLWLDYSERERRKMLELADLFRSKEALDELGIGTIRDALADQLFPGISTVMTRARYFLFVPWMYRRLEEKEISSREIADLARGAELRLVEPIEGSLDNAGNIGRQAKNALRRLPSSIYWHGLAVWGIRQFPGAQSQYHRYVDRFYQERQARKKRSEERDAELKENGRPNWHEGLVPPPENFPKECSLALTRREAEYLTDRIRLSAGCRDSVLQELADPQRKAREVDFVWDHDHLEQFTPAVQEKVRQARHFSELIRGASILYNLILAEETGREEAVENYRQLFADWVALVDARWEAFSAWSRESFWQTVYLTNPRISFATVAFVESWWDLLPQRHALLESIAARELITTREYTLKRNLSRIGNKEMQATWGGMSGALALDFRWGIAKSLLADIYAGWEADHA
jgi:hypothetical protein